MSVFSFKQRVVLAIVPRVAMVVISVLGWTLRYEDVYAFDTKDRVPEEEIPGPAVYAFWHRSLLACAYRFRGMQIAILISPSFDGELIARVVERLGFKAIRGSSSQGGAAGLRNMIEAYKAGHRCAITADGPRGPAEVAKPGTAYMAQLVGAPWVGTFHAEPNRAWTLKSWDRFLIPKPFSKVRLTFPKHVPTSSPDLRGAIQAALDEAVRMSRRS